MCGSTELRRRSRTVFIHSKDTDDIRSCIRMILVLHTISENVHLSRCCACSLQEHIKSWHAWCAPALWQDRDASQQRDEVGLSPRLCLDEQGGQLGAYCRSAQSSGPRDIEQIAAARQFDSELRFRVCQAKQAPQRPG